MVTELVPKHSPSRPSVIDFNRAYDTEGLEGLEVALIAAKRAAGLQSQLWPSVPQFDLIPAAEVHAMPKYEFYSGGLLQACGINLICGAPKVGKSFVVLAIASEIGQDAAVLYAAAEGLPGYGTRIDALESAYKRPIGNLTFTRAVNLYENETVAAFIEAVRPRAFKVIVFDTLAACSIGAAENSDDMQVVMSNCQKIIDALGCAVILVHHSTKAGGTYRGHSSIFGSADVMLEVNNDDGIIALTDAGAKNRDACDPHFYNLVPYNESVAAMRTERHLTESAKLTPLQVKLLENLRLGTFVTAGAKSAQLITILAVPAASVYRALGGLIDKGYVRQAAKGDPYYIEDAGIKALSQLSNHSHESAESVTPSLNSTLSHSHTPIGVRVERVGGESPASKEKTQPLSAENAQQPNRLPYLDAVIQPLHSTNGRHG